MRKKQVKFAIKKAIQETYSKAGFTTTADKFLKIFFKKIDKLK